MLGFFAAAAFMAGTTTVLPDLERKPLIRVNAFLGIGPYWSVAVWPDGVVDVGGASGESRYTLTQERFAELKRVLDLERPWEISGFLGEAIFEGPERTIETHYAGRHGSFTLYRTPEAVSRAYPEGAGPIARGIRVCEAVSVLALDQGMRRCLDVGPNTFQMHLE